MHNIRICLSFIKSRFCSLVASESFELCCSVLLELRLLLKLLKEAVQADIPIMIRINKTRQPPQPPHPHNHPFSYWTYAAGNLEIVGIVFALHCSQNVDQPLFNILLQNLYFIQISILYKLDIWNEIFLNFKFLIF